MGLITLQTGAPLRANEVLTVEDSTALGTNAFYRIVSE
jgi:hypothetical protein